IYDFEVNLNFAKDKAFASFIDASKDTWKAIHKRLLKEAGTLSNYMVNEMFFALLKQEMIDVNFSSPEEEESEEDIVLNVKAYRQVNYISNKGIQKQRVWT